MRLRAPLEVTVRLTLEEAEALRAAVERMEPLTPLAKRALERLALRTLAAPGKDRQDPVVYTPLADEYPRGFLSGRCGPSGSGEPARSPTRTPKGRSRPTALTPTPSLPATRTSTWWGPTTTPGGRGTTP